MEVSNTKEPSTEFAVAALVCARMDGVDVQDIIRDINTLLENNFGTTEIPKAVEIPQP